MLNSFAIVNLVAFLLTFLYLIFVLSRMAQWHLQLPLAEHRGNIWLNAFSMSDMAGQIQNSKAKLFLKQTLFLPTRCWYRSTYKLFIFFLFGSPFSYLFSSFAEHCGLGSWGKYNIYTKLLHSGNKIKSLQISFLPSSILVIFCCRAFLSKAPCLVCQKSMMMHRHTTRQFQMHSSSCDPIFMLMTIQDFNSSKNVSAFTQNGFHIRWKEQPNLEKISPCMPQRWYLKMQTSLNRPFLEWFVIQKLEHGDEKLNTS